MVYILSRGFSRGFLVAVRNTATYIYHIESDVVVSALRVEHRNAVAPFHRQIPNGGGGRHIYRRGWMGGGVKSN